MTSTTQVPKFSLVHDPWIPTGDGDVSLEEAFRQSRSVGAVASANAALDAAVFRFAIAVMYRAYGLFSDPDEDELDVWERVWNADNLFDGPVERYLAEHGDSMTLEHLLVPELKNAKGEWKDTASMFQSRRLFPQAIPAELTPAEVVRSVLYVQAWDTAGIKTGDPADPRTTGNKVYGARTGSLGFGGATVFSGASFHETVCLNWVPGLTTPDDKPMWERAPYPVGPRPGVDENYRPGVCELLTWQSRRINVRWRGDRCDGVMVSTGDNLSDIAFDGAEPMANLKFREKSSKKHGFPVYTPAPLRAVDRGWRCLGGILPSAPRGVLKGGIGDGGDEERPSETARFLRGVVDENIVPDGFVLRAQHISYDFNDESSVINFERQTVLPLPSAALVPGGCADTIIAAADYTEEVVAKSVRSFVWSLDIASGGEGKWESTRMNSQTARFYRDISDALPRWVEEMDPSGGVGELERWKLWVARTVERTAGEIIDTAPVSAFHGVDRDGRSYSVTSSLDHLRRSLRPKRKENVDGTA